jgi:hypothetical protein
MIKKIGYCQYHLKHKLDDWGECSECEKEIMDYGHFRSGKPYNKNNRLIKLYNERG